MWSDLEHHLRRFLEEEVDDDGSKEPLDPDDTNSLRNTLRLYGSIFVVLFLLFCFLRQKFPNVYQVRGVYDKEYKTDLAKDKYGFFSWVWHLWNIDDEILMEEIGLDGLCLTRVYDYGWKVSLVGMWNAIWLLPLYWLAEEGDDTDHISDQIVSLTVSHVPAGDVRLIGATGACYLMFGVALYLLKVEIDWYNEKRFQFLTKANPRNYSVYIRCIPETLRSEEKLITFFKGLLPEATVEEVHIGLSVPLLQNMSLARDATLFKLEHAMNVKALKTPGVEPMHKTKIFGGEKVESIPQYTKELEQLNKELKFGIERVENEINEVSNDEETTKVAAEGIDLVNEKGKPKFDESPIVSAAFVSFNSLRSANAALQMVHHTQVFAMEALQAPEPEDVFWPSVGKTHVELQIGSLVSFLLTAVFCLFWTAIMAFVTSLSSIEGLRNIGFIDSALDAAPFLVPVLAQIAPLFVVIVNALLVVFLKLFSSFEYPISGAVIEASLFKKLAWFMIIQNFFVIALSGGLTSAYTDIIENPTSVVDLLATALPSQSTFFIQIVLVNVAISLSVELLGIARVAIHWIRTKFGPGLTEKEQNFLWFGLRTLDDPAPYLHGTIHAWTVLYFMIFFVYATIAPISTVALGLTFFILSISFRHQFVYIYPRHPDTGGKMFVGFINFAFTCIIVSELTVVGFLGIKQNPVAAGLMFPLIVVTIGFMIYIKQKHMSHGNQLPSSVCMEADYRNAVEGSIDFSFIKNAYLHPALKAELDVKPEEANMLGAKAVNQTAPSKELSEDSNTGRGDEVNQDEVA